MNMIYIAHSMTNGQKDIEPVHKLIDWLKLKKKYNVDHPYDISIFHNYLADKSLKIINKMDIIIADVSNYSHGVGFELGYACASNKKIIVICNIKTKDNVSKFLIGLFPDMIFYENENDLIKNVSKELDKIFPPVKRFF